MVYNIIRNQSAEHGFADERKEKYVKCVFFLICNWRRYVQKWPLNYSMVFFIGMWYIILILLVFAVWMYQLYIAKKKASDLNGNIGNFLC